MISVSKATSTKPSAQVKFVTQPIASFKEFANIITTKVWSPILWEDGRRAKFFFKSCQFYALDFDSGEMTIDECKQMVEDYGLWHVIGTTKSHQIEKVSKSGKTEPACDRFRLILKANDSVHLRELYEYNMKLMTSYFPIDPSCTDAARYFWPCTKIVAMGGGRKIPWLEYDDDYIPEDIKYERRSQKLQELGTQGRFPKWVEDIIKGREKVPPGQRHVTTYRIGATLAGCGYTVKDFLPVIMNTNLKDIGEYDVIRALRNGALAWPGGKYE